MQNLGNITPRKLSLLLDDTLVQATGTITSDETVPTAGDTVTINGREYTFVDALTGAADEVLIVALDADATLQNLADLINEGRAAAAAGGVLTSNNSNPSNGQQVVMGANTYTFKTNLTEVKASGVLTSDETNPADGDTVTIGSIVYTFKTTLDAHVPYQVKIGADADTTLANLRAAINGSAGIGTIYGMDTVAHPLVTCGAVTSHAVTVTANSVGTGGNAIAKAESSSHLDWDGTGDTLSGGLASVANEVKIGADANTTLANLKAAVNGGAGSGTAYSSATVASTEILAGAIDTDLHTLTVAAIDEGIAGNSLAKTENSATLDWDGAGSVMTGGVDESTINEDVTSGDVTTHAITLTAIAGGVAGNVSLAESSTHLSKSGTALTGGGGTIGTVLIGNEGGLAKLLVVDIPELGSATYTVAIQDADGDALFSQAGLADATKQQIALDVVLKADDVIKVTASAAVSNTTAIKVHVR